MPATVYIYGLADETGIRYVGQSVVPRRRLDHHWSTRNRGQSHKQNWLKSLDKRGTRPNLVILEEASFESRNECERKWVDHFLVTGARLVNGTSGGDATWTSTEDVRKRISEGGKGRKLSEETKKRISESNRGMPQPPSVAQKLSAYYKGKPNANIWLAIAANVGRPLSEDHRNKISDALTGRQVSTETRERMSRGLRGKKAWNKGVSQTAEVRAKLSMANKGRPGRIISAEECARISARQMGRKYSSESKAKMSAAKKGKKLSAETRARMSAAHTGKPSSNKGKQPHLGKKARQSSSRYLGVSASKLRWCVRVTVALKHSVTVGYYDTEIEAALAYNHFVTEQNLSVPLNDIS